jgi:2'-5' RNA ligase
MAYALELQFDPAADAAVRGLWAALEAAGIPTPAREVGRPHLSLARCDAVDPARLAAALSGFARAESAFEIAFGGLGVFAPEAWVFLAPVASERLLQLHARVHDWLGGLTADASGVTAVHSDSYAPGRWVPHCTLTTRLEPALAAKAVERCLRTDLPRAARIERIGLTHYPPVAELHSYVLGSRKTRRDS